MAEQFYPTVCFGITMVGEKTVMSQMVVDQWGTVEWRPVPMVEMKQERPAAIAGTIEDE